MIFTFGAIIIGLLMLTGHSGILMKGGNDKAREAQYDVRKMEKATGIALLIIGGISGIDAFTTGIAAKTAYLVAVVVIFVGLFFYIKNKCKK